MGRIPNEIRYFPSSNGKRNEPSARIAVANACPFSDFASIINAVDEAENGRPPSISALPGTSAYPGKLIPEISVPVRRYLEGVLRAGDLVRTVDDLVTNDFLDGQDAQILSTIERLHEALALYVRDEPTRMQEPGIYIGDDQLRERAIEFEQSLKQIELR